MIRVGLVGPGGIAEHCLAPALAKSNGAELWSVLSRDTGRARAFAGRHGARSPSPAHTDYAAMLADPKLDAVLLASPDGLHAEQAVLAARAKKHVLVEKPMATSAADARRMIDACAENGVKLGVAYHLRFHAGHRALAAAVHAGALGDVRHVRTQWTYRAPDASNWRARQDVGRWWALAGVGTHLVDFVRWLLVPVAGEVTAVSSTISREVHKGPHEETVVAGLRFASGATADVVCSVLFDSTPSIEIFGAAASAACEGTLGPHGKGRVRLRGEELAFTPVDPYVGEIEDFVRAITSDVEPEVPGREGLRNVELLEAIAS